MKKYSWLFLFFFFVRSIVSTTIFKLLLLNLLLNYLNRRRISKSLPSASLKKKNFSPSTAPHYPSKKTITPIIPPSLLFLPPKTTLLRQKEEEKSFKKIYFYDFSSNLSSDRAIIQHQPFPSLATALNSTSPLPLPLQHTIDRPARWIQRVFHLGDCD